MIAVFVSGPVSGAHLNPAVSIAMLTLRSITPLQCVTYILSRQFFEQPFPLIEYFLEFIGAFLAAALVFGTYYDAINQFDGGIRQVEKRFFSLV